MKETLHIQLTQASPATSSSSTLAPSQNLDDAEPPNADEDITDLILSQDLFCTPDYITPENQNLINCYDFDTDDTPCPKSPEKLNATKSKRCRLDDKDTCADDPPPAVDLGKDTCSEEFFLERPKPQNYVSQSAAALRLRVLPPPCISNPYLKNASEIEIDPFARQRLKCAAFFPAFTGGDGLPRYRTDFHEIQQIGGGYSSNVFKVFKRLDGCLYAVKRSVNQLHLETDKKEALMEVQALAALGFHENIVRYYSSWFENEQLHIQMELCDHSLSIRHPSVVMTQGQVLDVLFQVANALRFIHGKGIAHLDVKPANIYVKDGVYKLGDFGCATLLDNSMLAEEGDVRYMPQEILNNVYDHLDKVDVFSLGASIYELIRGRPLPQSGCQFLNLREGKLPLLPGHSIQLQNLLKVMMDPNPVKRPSAEELVENPIFHRNQRAA